MGLFDKIKTSADVAGLENVGGKSEWTLNKGRIFISIQPAKIEDDPLFAGGDFTRQFVGYVSADTEIKETDRIHVGIGDFAGVYKVRGISKYPQLTYFQHKKILLEKTEQKTV